MGNRGALRRTYLHHPGILHPGDRLQPRIRKLDSHPWKKCQRFVKLLSATVRPERNACKRLPPRKRKVRRRVSRVFRRRQQSEVCRIYQVSLLLTWQEYRQVSSSGCLSEVSAVYPCTQHICCPRMLCGRMWRKGSHLLESDKRIFHVSGNVGKMEGRTQGIGILPFYIIPVYRIKILILTKDPCTEASARSPA